MKISKLNLLMMVHFMMLSGICSAAQVPDEETAQEFEGPSLTTKIEKSLKHTSRYEDDDSIEHIADTVKREVQYSVKNLEDTLEPELKALNGYLAKPEAEAVEEYNSQFSRLTRWARGVSTKQEIETVRNDKEKEIANEKEHIRSMLSLAFELVQKEQAPHQKALEELQKYLQDPKTAVAKYNKQFYMWQIGSKVSNIQQLKDMEARVENAIKFWNDYMEGLRKLVPFSKVYPDVKMPKYGFGLPAQPGYARVGGGVMPISPTYKTGTTIMGRKISPEERSRHIAEQQKKKAEEASKKAALQKALDAGKAMKDRKSDAARSLKEYRDAKARKQQQAQHAVTFQPIHSELMEHHTTKQGEALLSLCNNLPLLAMHA